MNFYNRYAPSEALQDIVEYYWHSKCVLNESLVQEMYTPTFQALSFNLSGWSENIVSETTDLCMDKACYIIGQPLSKRTSLSHSEGINILGVKFTSLGLYLLTGIDMKHISDKIIDATNIWNSEISLLHEEMLHKKTNLEKIAVLECFLINKRKQHCKDERIALLKHSLHQMEYNNIFSVTHLRENNFISKKTFERYFLNYIGVSPKQYANICRFNNVRNYLDGLAKEADWNGISLDFGYYDQSHLIREFKRYAGKTPSEYFYLSASNLFSESGKTLQQIYS